MKTKTNTGIVKAIFITKKAGNPMEQVGSAKALEKAGIEGDRYSKNEGFYVKTERKVRDLTLITVEDIETSNKELDQKFGPIETRRNILTEGIDLNPLVGKKFSIGKVKVKGTSLCTSCKRPGQITGKDGFKMAFKGRGGIRVRILNSGHISVGDKIQIL